MSSLTEPAMPEPWPPCAEAATGMTSTVPISIDPIRRNGCQVPFEQELLNNLDMTQYPRN